MSSMPFASVRWHGHFPRDYPLIICETIRKPSSVPTTPGRELLSVPLSSFVASEAIRDSIVAKENGVVELQIDEDVSKVDSLSTGSLLTDNVSTAVEDSHRRPIRRACNSRGGFDCRRHDPPLFRGHMGQLVALLLFTCATMPRCISAGAPPGS